MRHISNSRKRVQRPRCCMDKDIGSAEAGKHADIVAVPGNPLEDISVMKRVDFVMKGGRVYKGGAQAASP